MTTRTLLELMLPHFGRDFWDGYFIGMAILVSAQAALRAANKRQTASPDPKPIYEGYQAFPGKKHEFQMPHMIPAPKRDAKGRFTR